MQIQAPSADKNASDRGEQLKQWLERQLPQTPVGLPKHPLTLTPLSGDAGFRRYYRLNTQPTLLAVDAPPERENTQRFSALARLFSQSLVATPSLLAVDAQAGFMLQEDFGDRLLLHVLKAQPDSAPVLYGEALMQLLALQQTPAHRLLPAYDGNRLRRELALFPEWFCGELLGHGLDARESEQLQQGFELLENSALEQPQVAVHRDYHSRNLVLRPDQSLGVIDFQDAVWGPITYDAVSLLKDCYIRWPEPQVRQWALGYGNLAAGLGLISEINESQFMRWFDWMGLQRHLKVLGIFARLALRDGKTRYLQDLPLVLRYSLEVLGRYPELAGLRDWFERRLLPLAETQSWYRDYRQAGESS